MIYRAVVEGGSERIREMDSFHLFFEAPAGNYRAQLDAISSTLLGDQKDRFDIYNVWSEWELKELTVAPHAFVDCHLVETGISGGRPVYTDTDRCMVFLTSQSRRTVLCALERGRVVNERGAENG